MRLLYIDGACTPNPGRGGYCGILVENDAGRVVACGSDAETTNQRMELKAAIAGLDALSPGHVVVYTDSLYVVRGFSDWLPKWKRRNWRTNSGPVKNPDLWYELERAAARHSVVFRWLRGHDGERWNELADSIANQEANNLPESPAAIAFRILADIGDGYIEVDRGRGTR